MKFTEEELWIMGKCLAYLRDNRSEGGYYSLCESYRHEFGFISSEDYENIYNECTDKIVNKKRNNMAELIRV